MKSSVSFRFAFLLLAGGFVGAVALGAADEALPVLAHARHVLPQLDKEHSRPTPDKPVYFVPVSGGYLQRGPAVAGEDPLLFTTAWPHLRKALASQGYLAAVEGGPFPTLVLTFHWGTLNPDRVEAGMVPSGDDDIAEESSGEVIVNLREMLALTGGVGVESNLQFERDEALERASEDRYFVLVTAYEMAAAMEPKRRKKRLWQTVLSVPSARIGLAAAFGPMVAAGAPFFGRDEGMPKQLNVNVPAGRVDIGTPIVVDHPTESAPKRR